MFDATHGWGRRGIETYAVSGVDIALWDLLGKACGRPVYELLGDVVSVEEVIEHLSTGS